MEFRSHHPSPTGKIAGAALACLLVLSIISVARAAIPGSERAALDALYAQTGGSSWTVNTGWEGAANECSWFGITCDAGQTHIVGIDLFFNNLNGTFPDLSQLPQLQTFDVGDNNLHGQIPDLSALTALQSFDVQYSQLTGPIPALAALTALQHFDVVGNQLTGSVPALNALTALQDFDASGNQLNGSIPSLDGLTALQNFSVDSNRLTGSIPSLADPTALQNLDVHDNQLSGAIPPLSALTALSTFDASNNRLTGNAPDLTNLTVLGTILLGDNELTGPLPVPPNSDSLIQGADGEDPSSLCPNFFTPASSPESATDLFWDAATDSSPWSALCAAAPVAGANAVPAPALGPLSLLILIGLFALVGCVLVRHRVF